MRFTLFILALTLHLSNAQTTYEPIPTLFALTCNVSGETPIYGFLASDDPHYYGLTVPNEADVLIISICNDYTEFNTTLTLFDDTMTQIAYDDNGCNDDVGRSRIKIESITPGNYLILLDSPEDSLESQYRLDVACEVAATVPTSTDFDWFMSTTDVACPDCPYNVTLSGIGNITIEECEDDDGHSWKHRRLSWGSHHSKPWNDDDDDTKTWFKDCIETDGDRRRLWGYRGKKSNDGCNNDKPTTTTTTTDYLEEWYKDKCDLDEWDHTYNGAGYGHRNHWHHHRYTHWHHHKHNNDFLTEVCIRYTISGLDDCGDVDSVFLGICENNNTDFNSSALSVDDLSGLIVSINNNSEGIGAVGAEMDGKLGILVVFEEGYELNEFELCLGNVTVDADFNEERDTVDIGEGLIGIDGTYECNADGLPCLNFFFDIPCPPEATADASCECMGGMSSLTLLYDPSNELDADIIGYYNARKTTAVLCEFTAVSPGTEIECISDTYGTLSSSTYFVITYDDTRRRRRMGKNHKGNYIDPGDCSGKFDTSCSEQIIGTTSTGCDDLIAVEFISSDGSLCNEEILDEETASANLISGVESIFHSSPLKVLQEMDPYIRYSLYGIVVAFAVLTLVACYICMVRDNGKRELLDDGEDDIQREIRLNTMGFVSVEEDNLEMTGLNYNE